MSNILIQASKSDTKHKMKGNFPKSHYCFWSVNGRPKNVEVGEMVLFSDGDRVYAKGVVLSVKDGEIRFSPLQRVDEENPVEPPSRGFKYIDGDNK